MFDSTDSKIYIVFFLLFFLAALGVLSPAVSEGGEGYLLREEDVIRIDVQNYPDLNRIIAVRKDGFINYAPLGELRASGFTAYQLEGIIQNQLDSSYKNPEVNVTIESYANHQVYILGEVKNPGKYNLRDSSADLLTAISLAGGVSDKADVTKVTLCRSNIVKHYNLNTIKENNSHENIILHPEDLIYVPLSANLVKIEGEVNLPGGYHVEDSIGILELLYKAEGLKDSADISNIKLFRNGNKVNVNLDNKLKNNEGLIEDDNKDLLTLKPGDRIVVPGLEKGWIDILGNHRLIRLILKLW